MNSRLELQSKLEAVKKVKMVVFQPPESAKLCFPCIVYKWDGQWTRSADDENYHSQRRYSLTVIDSDPDSTIPEDLLRQFNKIRLDRTFTAENLHHWVFTLYY